MPTIFTKIVNGEIPCHKVAENDKFLAFLDISPIVEGHTLVIPKKETDYIFDIDDQELSEMVLFSKQVAIALKKAVPCLRIGVSVIGLEVPHAHIHLIPLNSMADCNFSSPRLKLSQEEFAQIAKRIADNF